MADFDYTIRNAVTGDEDALALVGAATFLDTYAGLLRGPNILAHCRKQHSAEKYRSWLDAADARVCLTEVDGAPVGYAVLCPPDVPVALHANDIELRRIYLLQRFQGVGIGAALMRWSMESAQAIGMKRILLGVNAANAKALAFYERSGFSRLGRRSFQVGEQICEDLILGRELR